MLQEQRQAQRRSGHFNHGAHPQGAVGHAASVQLLLGLGQQLEGLVYFAGMGQHGDEQIHLAKHGGPQNGPQLAQKHAGIGQAPTNGTQAQRGIQMGFVFGGAVQGLISSHVHGADGDRQTLHAFYRTLVGLELLFFIGQLAFTAHE